MYRFQDNTYPTAEAAIAAAREWLAEAGRNTAALALDGQRVVVTAHDWWFEPAEDDTSYHGEFDLGLDDDPFFFDDTLDGYWQ